LSWFGLGSLKDITAFSRVHIVARSSPKLKKSSLNRRFTCKNIIGLSLVYNRFSVAFLLRPVVIICCFSVVFSFVVPLLNGNKTPPYGFHPAGPLSFYYYVFYHGFLL